MFCCLLSYYGSTTTAHNPPRQIHSRVIPTTPEEGNVAMSFTLPRLVTQKHIHRGNAGNIYQGGFWLLTWIYHLLQPRPPFRGNSDPFHQSSFDKATVKHTHVQIHFDFFFAMQLRLPRTYFKIPETKGEWVEGKWVKYLSPEIRKHGHGKKKRKKHGMVRDRKLSVYLQVES